MLGKWWSGRSIVLAMLEFGVCDRVKTSHRVFRHNGDESINNETSTMLSYKFFVSLINSWEIYSQAVPKGPTKQSIKAR